MGYSQAMQVSYRLREFGAADGSPPFRLRRNAAKLREYGLTWRRYEVQSGNAGYHTASASFGVPV